MPAERWTHAIRRPGPNPDRCAVELAVPCACDRPVPEFRNPPDDDPRCAGCGHALTLAYSIRPSDSPLPR